MRGLTGFGAIPRTLAHRNFGIYTAGGAVSLIGTWMQRIGVGWLAWELSHSGAVLGLVALADLAPTVVIGPFGGALADRVDRRRLMMIAQSLIMAQALTLYALTAAGQIEVWSLLALTLLGGVVIGFNQPARLAFVPSLVPRDHLNTAVAINSIVFNGARFVGPAVAGVVIVQAGIAWVFAINALTFVAFLLALANIHLAPPRRPAARPRSMLAAVVDGVRYTWAHPAIGPILLLHAVLSVCARPFVELMPGFAAEVFGRGAPGLAILSSTVGVGAVAGGLWLAQRRTEAELVPIVLGHSLLIALAVLAFALTAWFPLAVAAATLAGLAMVVAGVGTQTVIQTTVDEAMRGRVLSLFGLIFRGGPAVGALLMGLASELVGLQLPLVVGTVLGLVAWSLIWRERRAIAAGALAAPGD
jgi:MFS family permease